MPPTDAGLRQPTPRRVAVVSDAAKVSTRKWLGRLESAVRNAELEEGYGQSRFTE